MIRVFVSDIDGCLSEPYRPMDLGRMAELRRLAADGDRGRVPSRMPDLSICTGRSYSYVEAVTQVLGLRVPVLFESGSGMFDPVTASIRWHPAFTPELDREMADLRAWMGRLAAGTTLSVDYVKKTQAGIIGPDEADVERLLPVVRRHVADHHPTLMVAATWVSIDVLHTGLSKKAGLAWLADEMEIELSEMAFIGDTEGDLGGLSVVGRSFAPANADEEVRASVQTVTRGRHIEGVLEAYVACARENRRG